MPLRGLALAQLRPDDLAPSGPKGAPCPGRPSGTRRGRGPPRGRRRRQGPATDVQGVQEPEGGTAARLIKPAQAERTPQLECSVVICLHREQEATYEDLPLRRLRP